jgi:pyruvate kinase
MPRTKIVCTLGPACDAPGVLRDMVRAGMDVARINFSHGDYASHARRIADLRRIAQEEGATLAVLCDLQGPKLRVGNLAAGSVVLTPNGQVTLTTRPVPGDAHEVNLPHPDLVADVQPGQRLLLDDGTLELNVESKTETDLCCRVVVGGALGPHKGVSAPGAHLSLSSLTDKDRADALFALEQQADYIALSFVRRAADVQELRAFIAAQGAHIPIVAKIEKAEALQAFDGILAASDAIMVARGDLGVETPAEQVPFEQKRILRECNRAGKPAITATQMLQSMMGNPRPTRAEASDVANAVLDGTDAVMLSGETATGHYPVQAVQTMERVATIAESHVECEEWLRRVGEATSSSEAIARATVEIAMELNAAAIVTSTMSGHTAQMVTRYRPCMRVLAATPDPAVYRRMALVWGVTPLSVPEYASTDEMIEYTTRAAREAGLVNAGDCVVITAGIPAGGEGRTNMLKVHTI